MSIRGRFEKTSIIDINDSLLCKYLKRHVLIHENVIEAVTASNELVGNSRKNAKVTSLSVCLDWKKRHGLFLREFLTVADIK